MEECISSSDDSSSSASSADDDKVANQNSNFKCLPINPGLEQSTTEQPILYHCPFCCFQGVAANLMQEHLIHHFTKSAHQCQLCTFSVGSIPELYLHIQQHHLIEDQSSPKVNTRLPGGNESRIRSAIIKCGQCEFVTKYKQELQRHETRHKEKSRFQCGLCSYSVSASFYLALHLKNHHSAHQNTPAPIQEISFEPARRLIPTKEIKLKQVRTKEPPTISFKETHFPEVRSEPPIPLVKHVQLEPSRLKKWRVESYQARDINRLAPRISEDERRIVKGPNPVRLRLAQRFATVSNAFQRRKRHGLIFNQAKNMNKKKKKNDFLKKKSTPQEAEAAVPVDAVPNTFLNNRMKKKLKRKKPKAQKVDVAAPVSLKDVKVEPDESTREASDNKKRSKTLNGQSVFKCSDCEYSTARSYAMKRHQGKHKREGEFKCSDCEYSTSRLDTMKKHEEKHKRKEEFKCEYCSFSARFKRHVSTHSSRFHHEALVATEFKCSDCEYFTTKWHSMKRHRLGHEQEREYKCDRCSYSARFNSRVRLHSNRYHRNPPSAPLEVKKESHGNSMEKIQLLTRIKNMKSKVSTAEQEKKQILAQKKDVEQKMKKMEEKN